MEIIECDVCMGIMTVMGCPCNFEEEE